MASGGEYTVVTKKRRVDPVAKYVPPFRARNVAPYIQTHKCKELNFKRHPILGEDGIIRVPAKTGKMMSVWMMEQLAYFVRGTNDDFSTPNKTLLMDMDIEDPIYKAMDFEYLPDIEFETLDKENTKIKEDCVAIIDNVDTATLICGVTTPVPLMVKHMGKLGGLSGTGVLGPGGISDCNLPDNILPGTFHPCYNEMYMHTLVPCLVQAVNLVVSPKPKPLLCVIWTFDMKKKKVISVCHKNIIGHIRRSYVITEGGMDHMNLLLDMLRENVHAIHGVKLNEGNWSMMNKDIAQMASLLSFTKLEWTKLLIKTPDVGRLMIKTPRKALTDFNAWIKKIGDCTVAHKHMSMLSGWCSRDADMDDPIRQRKIIGHNNEMEVTCTVNKPFTDLSNLGNQIDYLGARKLMSHLQENGFEHYASLGNGFGKAASVVGRALPRKHHNKPITMDVLMLIDSHHKCVSWAPDYPEKTMTGDFMSLRTEMTSENPGFCPYPYLARYLHHTSYVNGAIMVFKATITLPRVCHWDLFENVCSDIRVRKIIKVIPM
ncbi:hypothetical protein [Salmon gill poxvirus]